MYPVCIPCISESCCCCWCCCCCCKCWWRYCCCFCLSYTHDKLCFHFFIIAFHIEYSLFQCLIFCYKVLQVLLHSTTLRFNSLFSVSSLFCLVFRLSSSLVMRCVTLKTPWFSSASFILLLNSLVSVSILAWKSLHD